MDYPYFSYIFTIELKIKMYCKPNFSQGIHFPIQPTLPSIFNSSENEINFLSNHQPFFISRFNYTFTFLQVYLNTNP